MTDLAGAFTRYLPDEGRRAFTAEELASMEDVLDAALAWKLGHMPFNVAADLGTIVFNDRPSPGYTRFCAVLHTPKSDPRRVALLALCDHLTRLVGYVITTQGVFTRFDLGTADVVVH